MTEEEKDFVKRINVDKAKIKIKAAMAVSIISLITYIIPVLVGEYDFGVIFEIVSFIFILLSRNYIIKYDELQAKKYIIFAMLPIGWLLIYDFFVLCSYVTSGLDLVFLGFDYYFSEILLISNILIMLKINKDLAKADNPIRYKESTDWFYEKYEEKGNVDELK